MKKYNKKQHILFIAPLKPLTGGMPIYTNEILKSDLNREYKIELIDTSVPQIFKEHDRIRIFLSVYFLFKLLIKLITFRPKIIHIHASNKRSFIEKSFFALIGRLFFKKVIIHLHGSEFDKFIKTQNKIKKELIKLTFKLYNKVIVLSSYWKNLLSNFVFSNRLEIIPNAIYTSTFKVNKNNSNIIVKIIFIGAVGYRKGLSDLAEAINRLKVNNSGQFFLDIIGEEAVVGEFDKIANIYKTYNLIDCVQFHGALIGHPKFEMLRKADIFVLPSRNENFPISILEAMAAGLPIISTKVGGIPDCVNDGINGILIEPKCVDCLVKALDKLINDHELRKKMGTANRKEAIEKYDWSIITQKLKSVYNSI